ncbi:uncharacterized protein LOC132902121 isoform X1 [Amyelois transitella]|uniref:uncharacterized protein LOC132902121 isoform X1 n=2 Tax=Amyelois transitella TaxID=680683 RepID=UPI0029900849|nr:uncharacterized protein LOC132902121 isoform X1 [Amyelois transitella]
MYTDIISFFFLFHNKCFFLQINMVRNYKRKTDRGSYKKEDLQAAVHAVRNGSLTGYKAAQIYNIPRTTIMDHVHRKRLSNTLGKRPTLSPDIENNIASCLHIMEKYGFGLTRAEISDLVAEYVTKNNIQTCFKNGKPGKDWIAGFRERNNLSIKKPQPVEYARKVAADPFVLSEYYELLNKTIKTLGLQDKPGAIWNVDETNFSKDPLKSKIVGVKGHAATRTISTPGKDNTTVLLGASAAGDKIPPLIIFKGKYVWDEWTSPNAYPRTTYAATKNGWMESDVFEAFFKKSFLPSIGVERPVLLIYDGHATHVGLNIIEAARDANVTILKLPPHTSHILQPLDISVMKSFKDRWDKVLVKWQRLNIGVQLPKKEFSRIIGEVWAGIEPQILMNGFRKAGIYPFNPTAVDKSKLDPMKLARFQEQSSALAPKKYEPQNLISIVLTLMNKNITQTPNRRLEIVQECNSISTTNTKEQAAIKKPNIPFEELLLEKIKRSDTSTKVKRSRVATGAEVITHDDVLTLKREKQIKKNIKLEKNKKHISNNVCLLTQLSKNSAERQPFSGKQNLPACLQNQTPDARKIIVTSNIVLKKAGAVDYSSTKPGPSGIHKKKTRTNKYAASFMIKGKDNSKKKSGKENSKLYYRNKPTKSYETESTSSTTSVSGIMSCHSDSDILNFESDDDLNDIDGLSLADNENRKSEEENTEKENTEIERTHTVNTNNDHDAIEPPTDKNENVKVGEISSGNYTVKDYVLVRYYGKKWIYYVGVIESIDACDKTNIIYSIKFFKTVKKPKLLFKFPKKNDRDEVTILSIVKKVELFQDADNNNEYFLSNLDDAVYFL